MPKRKGSKNLLLAIAALPEEVGWKMPQDLKTGSCCSLLGGLAVTVSQVEILNALRDSLADASLWVRLAAAIPPAPLENEHDQFI
jgi:hypothetical protein